MGNRHPILGRRPKGRPQPPIIPVEVNTPKQHTERKQQNEPVVCEAAPTTPNTELDVTCVVVNYKTLHLTRNAIRTFRKHYPRVKLIVIDNGSGDESTEYIKTLLRKENITCILNKNNVGHGPAIEQAIDNVSTRYVFLMDSDCEVYKGGFLEQMQKKLEETHAYAIGWRRWVDKFSGVPREWHIDTPPSNRFVKYAHPAASLYDLKKYRQLSRAEHHGAPLTANMRDAAAKGWDVLSFPIFDYVNHLIAGTRRMFGGHWDGTNKKPREWKKKGSYPI